MTEFTRRTLLVGATAIAATTAAGTETTLRIGDQRGNQRAVLEAADALRDVPYKISWHEFPAAAPLIEALNAGAIDAGVVGDAPFTFGFAAGCRCGSSQRAGLPRRGSLCWCVATRQLER